MNPQPNHRKHPIGTLIRMRFLMPVLALLSFGCSSTDSGSKPQKGPSGTVAYQIQVEASEPGVRIEADQEYVGTTPCTVEIFGDKDGTFHSFGNPEYVIKAYPNEPDHYVQTKTFKTGWWFSQEDKIPSRIYFDMSEKPLQGFSVDLPKQESNQNAEEK